MPYLRPEKCGTMRRAASERRCVDLTSISVFISASPQIVFLERKLVEAQQSNCLSLEETREQAEKQIANFR